MDKAELLDHAVRLDNSPRAAIRLARDSLTDERLAWRRSIAAEGVFQLNQKLRMFESIAIVCAMLASALFIYEHSSAPARAVSVAFILCGITCLVLMTVRWVAEMLLNSRGAGLTDALLMPAAGTVHGELAVKALTTGGQMTALWRDIALRERGQLYIFDVLILEALAKSEWAEAMPSRQGELLRAST